MDINKCVEMKDFYNGKLSQDNNTNLQETKDIQAKDENIDWVAIIWFLLITRDQDTQKLWESYSEEVKYRNRYFPRSEFLERIDNISEQATCYIDEGVILYRAREYTRDNFLRNEVVIALANIIKEEFVHIEFETKDILNTSIMSMVLMNIYGNFHKGEVVAKRIKDVLERQTKFYGYDKSGSDAPPSNFASEGRANPKGISYLYATLDIKTAILEMRPQMQKLYNIAPIKLIKKAKIFDFTYRIETFQGDEYPFAVDLYRISEEFSKPNFGDPLDYIPTQFLCEYIKRKGYDGIKYKSAVSETGINILFFDTNEETRVYDIVGSEIYSVNSIDIDISKMFPMTEEEAGLIFDRFTKGCG